MTADVLTKREKLEKAFEYEFNLQQRNLSIRRQVSMAKFEKEQELRNEFEGTARSIIERVMSQKEGK